MRVELHRVHARRGCVYCIKVVIGQRAGFDR